MRIVQRYIIWPLTDKEILSMNREQIRKIVLYAKYSIGIDLFNVLWSAVLITYRIIAYPSYSILISHWFYFVIVGVIFVTFLLHLVYVSLPTRSKLQTTNQNRTPKEIGENNQ